MLKSLLNFGKAKTLLVCETDGFLLRGAVLMRAGNEVVVLHHAESQQADMAESVTELINSLKADGWEGDQAVLLSPTVLSTLIELPINPKKPRTLAQMQELIRWEVEPLLMQHTTQWSVGHLLVGRGYMTQEQAESVMDLQQGKDNSAGGLELSEKFSLRRFGDLAEELGYIKRSQLNACLAGQEWLKSNDENIECGWSAQGEVADIPGTFNWLVSCVNKGLLQRWTSAFNAKDIVLQSMYPLAGASTPLLSETIESGILLESQNDLALAVQIKDNFIVAQHLYLSPANQELEACLEAYHALNPPSSSAVSLASWHKEDNGLHEELGQALSVKLQSLNNSPVSKYLSPGMLGAGHHAFALSGAQRCTNVRLEGPLPTTWNRIDVRAATLFLFLFLSIVAAELSLVVRENVIENKKEDVDNRWGQISGAINRIKGEIAQVKKREDILKAKDKDRHRIEARLTFFSEKVPERAALVQAILGSLQSSISDEIIINSIDEFGKRVGVYPKVVVPIRKDTRIEIENFNLEAWALSETAAQGFIQDVERSLASWGLEVRDSRVISRLGPMSLPGFTVSMRLVKLVSADIIKQQKKQQNKVK